MERMKKSFKNILLIDDDEDNNIINRIVIKESGFKVQVDSVLSAQEALARLATGDKPDLIFLDINMPVLSGWDFLNEYKKLPEEKKWKHYHNAKQFCPYRRSRQSPIV